MHTSAYLVAQTAGHVWFSPCWMDQLHAEIRDLGVDNGGHRPDYSIPCPSVIEECISANSACRYIAYFIYTMAETVIKRKIPVNQHSDSPVPLSVLLNAA